MQLGSAVRFCLLAALVGPVAGCNKPAPEQSSPAGPQRWISDFTKAFQAKDANAIASLYAPEVIAYDLVPPLAYDGKDAYIKDFKDFFASFQGPLQLEFKDCKIESFGNLASMFCLEHVSGTMTNGQKMDLWLRDTSLFEKVDGKWLDYHDHVSVPIDLATGKAVMNLQP